MKELLQKNKEFQTIFKQIVNDKPTAINVEDAEFRYNLMREENYEYYDACKMKDVEAIADALGDQLYILLGTIISHGMDGIIEEVYNEIHRSNMSKLDLHGNPIFKEYHGALKIAKSAEYKPPQLEDIINRAING